MSSSKSRRPSEATGGPFRLEIPVSINSKDVTRNSGNRQSSRPIVPPKIPLPPGEASEATPDEKPAKICEICERPAHPIWNCSYCDMDFCDSCWDKQGPHKRGKKGPDGLPHEKANPKIVKRLKEILFPSNDQSVQEALHVEDEDTTWFGISRDPHNKPFFQDYGRYVSIMADTNTGQHQSRYPQLVSFIGQTGAGKSTLIKMLIDQQERIHGPHEVKFSSPVVGSVTHSNVPTSGDVHLYSDPGTYTSDLPILLADCEGLEGGEIAPISAQYREKFKSAERRGKDLHFRKRILRIQNQKKRELKWADTPEKSKRQYAVKELYPRLLYTFSDTIVFVLRNPKTFESTVLSMLIDWARYSIESSLNQPTLPHAIIALNATDTKIDAKFWDPEYATSSLMSDVAGAISRDPLYQELKRSWDRRGKVINNTKDLLECYYSSITVVRIPADGRYMMIDEQVQTLYGAISRRCKESYLAKRRSRMLSNSDALNTYLQRAFDHFSNDLYLPFNFMEISFLINPMPLDFDGHVLKLAVAMKAHMSSAEKIFELLSFMVASCILLDCARQNFKGPADQILEKRYLTYCKTALENFCVSYWPCSFRGKNGEQCVNFEGSHTKGHQNSKGKVMSTGPYKSSFTFESFCEKWVRLLSQHLATFQDDLSFQLMPSTANELEIVTKLHKNNIEIFYHRLGSAQRFISHQTCFCCLRELAEHPLPCGHVLCTPCIKSYGKPDAYLPYSYNMASCPLHQANTTFTRLWPIYFKPPLAGVRILSLDGGGMRGIVILEVLRKVQAELGNSIPIQDFFDLIVGTSTGGIIALALGIKNKGVNECIESFTALVGKAFTPRYPGGVRLSKSKYKSKPIESGLLTTFGEEEIFAGVIDDRTSRSARKVAVTAASETGDQAVIFANYNRANNTSVSYTLIQNDRPDYGLKIREAARATSAAPLYFKPFVNSRTNETFRDGAVYHNNPVRIANYESKLLWPDAEGNHPDILLSVGTAYHELSKEAKNRPATQKPFSELKGLIKMVKGRFKKELDSESKWTEFLNDVLNTSPPVAAQRYVRLNPKMIDPVPAMDSIKEYEELRTRISHDLNTATMDTLIEETAQRLIASSFYFERYGPVTEQDGRMAVKGTIRCRFAAESKNLSHLGQHLKIQFKRRNLEPFFRIQEVIHNGRVQNLELDREILQDMIDNRDFRIGDITIPISSETALISINLHLVTNHMKPHLINGFPISGFPRSLDDEEPQKRPISNPSSPAPTPTASPVISKQRSFLRIKGLGRPASENDVRLFKKDIDIDNQTDVMSKAHTAELVPGVARHLSVPGISRSSTTLSTSGHESRSSLESGKQFDEVVLGFSAGPIPPYEVDDDTTSRDSW